MTWVALAQNSIHKVDLDQYYFDQSKEIPSDGRLEHILLDVF